MSFDQLNTHSAWITESLSRASLHGGIAALVVWTLCALIPRLPANAKSWLWRLVFLKMLLALIWGRPIELPVLAPLQVQATALHLPSVETIGLADGPQLTHFTADIDTKVTTPASLEPEAEVVVPVAAVAANTPASSLNWKSLLTLAWLGGASIGLCILARQFFQARKLRRSVTCCANELLTHQLVALSRAIGLLRLPYLYASSAATRPMLIGILRPTLIFPEHLLATASSESLRMMIAHELAHIRRGDLAWTALAALLRIIFFFHPLVWLARRESLLAQEIACDELALQITSGTATGYAAMLVDVVSLPVSRAPALISLGVAQNRKTLERRIRNMKFIGHKKTKVIQFVAGLAIFTALIALIPFRVVAAEPETPGPGSPPDSTELQETEAAEERGVERDPPLDETPDFIGRPGATLRPDRNNDLFEAKRLGNFGRIEPDPLSRPATSLPTGEAARILQEIRHEDRSKLREILPTLTHDPLLTEHLKALSHAQQQYASIENAFAEEHPEIIRVRSVIKQINDQIESRIDGILAGLEIKARTDAVSRENAFARETTRSSGAADFQRETVRVSPAGPLSVHARVGGTVEKVMVSIGEDVKKGQPLLEMDNSAARSRLNNTEARAKIAQADLRIAQAELDELQREYEKRKKLAEESLVPQDSLPNLEKVKANIIKAEAQTELAKLERDQARQDLDRYILLAPRDGTISFIIHEGYFVPDGGGKILAEIRTPEGDRASRTKTLLQLQKELAALRLKEAELHKVYTQRHPEVREIQRKIKAIDTRLLQEDRDPPSGASLKEQSGTDSRDRRVEEVFVNGLVNNPGAIPLPNERELDIPGALARAGGLNERANRNKIKFTRPGEEEKIFSFEDLKQPQNRFPLQPGDIIEVPEKLF